MSDPQLSPMEIVDDQFNHNDPIGGTKLDLTIEDQRVLQALSLPEGQQWMLSSIAYHREYARTLCSMYNATATIHRYLPPELLMEIFGWIRPENFGELRLLGVSRVWRDLLLRTAEFWVDMLRSTFPPTKRLTSSHPNFDPESGWHRCYTMSLERSAPRDIFLTYTGFTELAFTALSPHTQRIASLSVELYPQNAQHLFRLLRFELPRLETLNVSHAHVAGQHAEELGGGTLPQLPQSSDHVDLPFLHVLHIPSVLCTSISAGNLRSLTIGCSSCNMCAEARRPSLDDILSFLRRCPALTSLRFLKTSEPARSRRHTEKGPMSLNQLHELIFEDVSASWASDILRRLTLLFHTVVKFRDLGTSRIPQRIKTLPAIHASDRLALEFRKDGGGPIICEADASIGDTSFVNVQVAVNTQNPADHDPVGSVASAFGSASVKQLRLWIPTSSLRIDRTRTIQLLASFPSITRLTWKRQIPNDLFQALQTPTSAGAPICAGLEHLIVHWRLGSQCDETIFRGACNLILSTLGYRASLGSRLRKFVFKCEGLRRAGPRFDAEGEKERLAQTFRTLVDEVVVGLRLDTTD
ncbi:hypothetical protein L226DRAFT_555774 [Lentinus tigrinus ALCF2SS1-7]|uniref:uncharacterized protein n=1 Tax=Lentinus tigrinus ALCF2SS1-7 TaxID=1328758 RepID=UPI0011663CC6|nr:hypothetical protein L226DRAFT_555774 [Lentinus tigrinus ALCF2SS1-7]